MLRWDMQTAVWHPPLSGNIFPSGELLCSLHLMVMNHCSPCMANWHILLWMFSTIPSGNIITPRSIPHVWFHVSGHDSCIWLGVISHWWLRHCGNITFNLDFNFNLHIWYYVVLSLNGCFRGFDFWGICQNCCTLYVFFHFTGWGNFVVWL